MERGEWRALLLRRVLCQADQRILIKIQQQTMLYALQRLLSFLFFSNAPQNHVFLHHRSPKYRILTLSPTATDIRSTMHYRDADYHRDPLIVWFSAVSSPIIHWLHRKNTALHRPSRHPNASIQLSGLNIYHGVEMYIPMVVCEHHAIACAMPC